MTQQTSSTIPRPPIIVVMGHIDHGKSTLLDYIRKSNTVAGETGGITQHISAYEVEHLPAPSAVQGATADQSATPRKITFLDTPGHEAFQNMRNHGAEVADIAILIVSAEDGVKAQTLEALESIRRGGIPFIVAINKIDSPNANPDKTKQELLEHGVYLEGLGGDVPVVLISAKRGDGIPDLLEMMLLVADIAELAGDPTAPATGVVIETNRDPRKGISATLVITNGTLRRGEFVVSGSSCSPVRIFEDFRGKAIDEATFSSPVRIVGWSDVPKAGAEFETIKSKRDAEQRAQACARTDAAAEPLEKTDGSAAFTLPIVLKADVAGTLDAIEHEMRKCAVDGVELRIVLRGIGSISEGDVKAALGNENTVIIGFNVAVDPIARDVADRNNVTIETFDIIYNLSEWLENAIKSRRPKERVEEVSGRMKVLKMFSQTKTKQVLGGRVEGGVIAVGGTVRIIRNDTEIGRGTVLNLQQNRTNMKKVEEGELGAEIKAAISIAPGDYLETFVVSEK